MFKLLLCTACMAPAILIPLTTTGKVNLTSTNVEFDTAYVDPEIRKIESCEAADLEIFFHDDIITSHSADFLGESLMLASDCGDVKVSIQPILETNANSDDEVLLSARVNELTSILAAYGSKAEILEATQAEEPSAMTLNGRAAIVKIKPLTGASS